MFTRAQSWIIVTVTTSGNSYTIPVDNLTIDPVPYHGGSDGSTAKRDYAGRYVYRCSGWRHDVSLSFDELGDAHHATVLSLLTDLHQNSGRCTIYMAYRNDAGSVVADASKAVEVVLDASAAVFAAIFKKRLRSRAATINFKGESPQSTPHSWLSS